MTFYSHVDPCTNQLRVVTQILESHNKKTRIAKTKQIYFPLYVLLDWFEHCQKTSQGLLIAVFSRNEVTLNPFSSSSIQPLSFRATKSAQKVSNSTSER